MFREMRRKEKELTEDVTRKIFENATNGVLGVIGDDGYPYTIPVSFVIDGDKIFFHCAKEGHKVDAIKKENKVSFCVVERDEILASKFSTNFKSAIVFGKARIVEDANEKLAGKKKILEKYSPDFIEAGMKYIEKAWENFILVEIKIEHITGKAGN